MVDSNDGVMSQREDIIGFFQKVCDDPTLQDQLKPPCPANRDGVANIAQAWGFNLTGADIDDYVRFAAFYPQFQDAIAQHQSGGEHLADWLNKWRKHLKKFEETPLDDRYDTIKRYL
ncbi:Nif11-like leader peptide family natural product precursor [Spirulina subsalsa]|nr:Nif11-like leader peptide family natural product precursor [Spirulina subsalsa]